MPDLENQEINDVAPEGDVKPNEGSTPIPEPSPAELEAREMGWVPKEEFHGDEHKWVDAGEFIRRGELFKKIDAQKKEIEQVREAIQLLTQHNKKMKDVEFQRALDYLKGQKKEALLNGDADQLIEIDEKITTVKEQQKIAQQEEVAKVKDEVETIHPEFEAWTNRNKWYTTNAPMKAFADALGQTLARQGKSPSEVLKEVERQVREEFPNRFKNPNRDKPGAVEGASVKSGGSSKSTYQPSEVERQVARKFVKTGVFKTEEEYYKQLEGISK
jgi:hypothetical protein